MDSRGQPPLLPPTAGTTPQAACLNCGRALGESTYFCHGCGQRTDTARLSLWDMARDLMNSPLHLERGPISFARALLLRPGQVARDYVAGRRRRYYGPFATLATVVGLTALVINATGYQPLAQDPMTPSTAQLLQRHFNLLQLAHLPLQALVCSIVFLRARLSWVEHMVLAAYTLSVRDALLTLVIIPAQLATSRHGPTPLEGAMFWLIWYTYFGWACAQFYGGRRWLAFLGGVAAAAAEHLTLIAIISGGTALLARWGLGSA
jgi:hypothetical protein